jgi:hypothetical protein
LLVIHADGASAEPLMERRHAFTMTTRQQMVVKNYNVMGLEGGAGSRVRVISQPNRSRGIQTRFRQGQAAREWLWHPEFDELMDKAGHGAPHGAS